jgi:hypothetical protein
VRERAAAACAALMLLASCAGQNAQTTAYSTFAEARKAGAIDAGRLPADLPPGVRDIRIGYIPGSSGQWGLFEFPNEESGALKAMLLPEEVPLDGLRVDVPGRIEWWPVALRGQLDGERLALTGLKAYRTLDSALVVAVNWNQGRAYYWNAGVTQE